ncbi:hypothetical protein RchiOBHm_Chr6g0294651 [Rosa chinensis]|uniref:Uncharacterized protein n=1 Tax=Rosa chinensis TaxID=74649 RepID=A0A2P6PWZ8_ROSCH|nr:hypothetical protein RchiOBHm_Chr6g0294651 [Rosa chinensis]
MEESRESQKWVFSTARERTYSAIASKIDFTSTLGTEEQIQKLVAHSQMINLKFSSLLKNTTKMGQDLVSVIQSLKALHKRLLVIEEHLGVPKRSASNDDVDD